MQDVFGLVGENSYHSFGAGSQNSVLSNVVMHHHLPPRAEHDCRMLC